MNIKKWIDLNTHDLTGKTIALTGTTGGLMSIVVDFLCSKNANLILLNRNKELTENQILNLKSKYPHINIEFVELFLLIKNNACMALHYSRPNTTTYVKIHHNGNDTQYYFVFY